MLGHPSRDSRSTTPLIVAASNSVARPRWFRPYGPNSATRGSTANWVVVIVGMAFENIARWRLITRRRTKSIWFSRTYLPSMKPICVGLAAEQQSRQADPIPAIYFAYRHSWRLDVRAFPTREFVRSACPPLPAATGFWLSGSMTIPALTATWRGIFWSQPGSRTCWAPPVMATCIFAPPRHGQIVQKRHRRRRRVGTPSRQDDRVTAEWFPDQREPDNPGSLFPGLAARARLGWNQVARSAGDPGRKERHEERPTGLNPIDGLHDG